MEQPALCPAHYHVQRNQQCGNQRQWNSSVWQEGRALHELHHPAPRCSDTAACGIDSSLGDSPRPAPLMGTKCKNVFDGVIVGDNVWFIQYLPPAIACAISHVNIFGSKGRKSPAAQPFNRFASPHRSTSQVVDRAAEVGSYPEFVTKQVF